jgi:hypothetical protein
VDCHTPIGGIGTCESSASLCPDRAELPPRVGCMFSISRGNVRSRGMDSPPWVVMDLVIRAMDWLPGSSWTSPFVRWISPLGRHGPPHRRRDVNHRANGPRPSVREASSVGRFELVHRRGQTSSIGRMNLLHGCGERPRGGDAPPSRAGYTSTAVGTHPHDGGRSHPPWWTPVSSMGEIDLPHATHARPPAGGAPPGGARSMDP